MATDNIGFVFENEVAEYLPLFKKHCPPPLSATRGADLCMQGITSGWMYYLLDGITKVYMINSDGKERIIDYMKSDTLIGMDCVVPGQASVVSIYCVTDIHVLPFNAEILRDMMDESPAFAYDLVLYYGKVLRQVTYGAGALSITNMQTRFANFLYLFVDTPSFIQTGRIDMTQDECASAINSSRAQIAKMCAQFRDMGIIKTGNRHITITDIEKLKKICAQ